MFQTLPKPDSQAFSLEDLGILVRRHRKRQGMRIDDAASLLGISTGVLSRMENGHPVGTDKMMRVLNGLGLNLFAIEKSEAVKVRRALMEAVSQDA